MAPSNPFWFFFGILIVLLFGASIALAVWGRKKKSKKLIILSTVPILIVIFCVLFTLITLLNWSYNSKSYQDDLVVIVPDSNVTLVIKEWTLLLGSGTEIYVLQDGNEIFLGETGSGDDVFCSFKDGNYEIINNGNDTITVRWLHERNIWNEKTFSLPKN